LATAGGEKQESLFFGDFFQVLPPLRQTKIHAGRKQALDRAMAKPVPIQGPPDSLRPLGCKGWSANGMGTEKIRPFAAKSLTTFGPTPQFQDRVWFLAIAFKTPF